MKKIASLVLSLVLVLGLFTGCNSQTAEISVISREDGSGTRGAFVELTGIEEKTEDGAKVDRTTQEAIVVNKTDVMLASVSGDENAIGYVSLGSLNDTVKAVMIDGVLPSSATLKDGSYAIARPFNLAIQPDPSPLAQDFVDFILSAEGQAIASDSYVPVAENAPAFAGLLPSGSLTISGSSSVSPLMEKLVEAYLKLNENAEIEIQTSDSTSGMNDAIRGIAEIGMASRALKESEAVDLIGIQIAMDGIAVIVNPKNEVESLSVAQLKSIFTGETTAWEEVA